MTMTRTITAERHPIGRPHLCHVAKERRQNHRNEPTKLAAERGGVSHA
jgi:hypothetical protein